MSEYMSDRKFYAQPVSVSAKTPPEKLEMGNSMIGGVHCLNCDRIACVASTAETHRNCCAACCHSVGNRHTKMCDRYWTEYLNQPQIPGTFAIIDTDNFGRDYPNEKFISVGYVFEDDAQKCADRLNFAAGENSQRFYRIVQMPYTLAPGFEA